MKSRFDRAAGVYHTTMTILSFVAIVAMLSFGTVFLTYQAMKAMGVV